jgi:hypothetical protein
MDSYFPLSEGKEGAILLEQTLQPPKVTNLKKKGGKF